jgi:hypothetical protein
MSQEYILALVLVVGSALKIFGIELDNSALEGILGGAVALWIAVRRQSKGDIDIFGRRV